MLEGSPRSVPCIPTMIIKTLQIAKPRKQASSTLPKVMEADSRPPTISMGMQIIVPIQIKAILYQDWRCSLGTRLNAFFSTALFVVLSIRSSPYISFSRTFAAFRWKFFKKLCNFDSNNLSLCLKY